MTDRTRAAATVGTACLLAVVGGAGLALADAPPPEVTGWHQEEVRTTLVEGFESFQPYVFFEVVPLRGEPERLRGPRKLLAYSVRRISMRFDFNASSRIYAAKAPPQKLEGTYAEDPFERAGAPKYRDQIRRARRVRDLEHVREVQRYRIAEVTLAGIRFERIPDADAGEAQALSPEVTSAAPSAANPERPVQPEAVAPRVPPASGASASAGSGSVRWGIGLALVALGLGSWFAKRMRRGRVIAMVLSAAGVAVIAVGFHRRPTAPMPPSRAPVAAAPSPPPSAEETEASLAQREAQLQTSIQTEAHRSYESRIAKLEAESKKAKAAQDRGSEAKKLRELKAALAAIRRGEAPWPQPELD